MPVKTTIPFRQGIFSITFTCTDWLPLIKTVNGYDIIYRWFDHLKSKGHFISGYVIMPNHVHALIGFSTSNQDINTMIGNGKRFMAYEITDRLKADGQIDLLTKMKSNIEASRIANRKQHNVWELSFDWKHCETEAFILQKLDYFHANPCTGKWNLCVNPIDYVHSSAKFYATGEQGIYVVKGYKELMNIDLTKGN